MGGAGVRQRAHKGRACVQGIGHRHDAPAAEAAPIAELGGSARTGTDRSPDRSAGRRIACPASCSGSCTTTSSAPAGPAAREPGSETSTPPVGRRLAVRSVVRRTGKAARGQPTAASTRPVLPSALRGAATVASAVLWTRPQHFGPPLGPHPQAVGEPFSAVHGDHHDAAQPRRGGGQHDRRQPARNSSGGRGRRRPRPRGRSRRPAATARRSAGSPPPARAG